MTNLFGIDVSKRKLDLCWLRDPQTLKKKSKVFSNDPKGFNQLVAWVEKQTNMSVAEASFCLEATGVYHQAVVYFLHQQQAQVRLAQPQKFHHYVASLGVRSKTDKADAFRLARYLNERDVPIWTPEPPQIRTLKALLARIEALKEDILREENRLEAIQISQVSCDVEQSILSVLDKLKQEKQDLEKRIEEHFDRHPDLKQEVKRLQSIPGVGPVVSHYMLSVLRCRAFKKATECAAFLGLNPVSRESGTSVQVRGRLSKTGDPVVRAKLYMAAVVAIRYNPIAASLYQRLIARGKAKMCALGAVMRKLVHMCFGVLKNKTEFCAQAS